MWGWGNLSANAIILFVESLAAKVDIPEEKSALLVRMVEDFCNKQLASNQQDTKKKPIEKIIRVSEAQRARRTTAFSAVQIQESFAKEKAAAFDTYSEGFSAKPKEEIQEKRKPDWLDNAKDPNNSNRSSASNRTRVEGNSSRATPSPTSHPIQRGSPESHGPTPFAGVEKPVINKTIAVSKASSTTSTSATKPRIPLGDPSQRISSRSEAPKVDKVLVMDSKEREQRNREQRKLFTKTVALDNRFINNLMSNDIL